MKSILKTIQNSCLRFAALTAVMLVLSLALTGCKYEDGPVVSFKSRRARLTGGYRITSYTVNGTDSTENLRKVYLDPTGQIVESIVFADELDGDHIYCYGCQSIGRFSGVDNGNKLRMSLPDGPAKQIYFGQRDWEIIRLTEDNTFLRYSENNTEYILEFTQY